MALLVAAAPMVADEHGNLFVDDFVVAVGDDGCGVILHGAERIAGFDMACEVKGDYITSKDLDGKKTERSAAGTTFTAHLPGRTHAIFTQTVSAENGMIRISFRRSGTWPKCDWISFQVAFPMERFSGNYFIADHENVRFPKDKRDDPQVKGEIGRVNLFPEAPGLDIALENKNGRLTVNDMRTWGEFTWQVDAGIPAPGDGDDGILITLPKPAGQSASPFNLRISQIGYPLGAKKLAILDWPRWGKGPEGGGFTVSDADGNLVKRGSLGPPQDFFQFKAAGLDFSDIAKEGEYKISCAGIERNVKVAKEVFHDGLWRDTLECFIPYQMCHASVDLPAIGFSRKAAFLDDAVRVPANFAGIDSFKSYGCEGSGLNEGEHHPCGIGGWFDAGDYDLNINAQGFSVLMLSLAFEEFRIMLDESTLDVEKKTWIGGRPDGTPDILQQIQWGVLWLLSMQSESGRVYVGVVEKPDRYGSETIPEEVTDNVPESGDERHLYADYHADLQLIQAIALASASRALKDAFPELSGKSISSAEKALEYFRRHPEVYRPTVYFRPEKENKGRDGMYLSALSELFITTGKREYLSRIESERERIAALAFDWPMPFETMLMNYWYSAPFLARLHGTLPDGELKAAVAAACGRAIRIQAERSEPSPYPFYGWQFDDWGNNGTCLARIFDAYWLSKAFPKRLKLDSALYSMLWIFGLHPLNDKTLACELPGLVGPRHLYNGQLHGRIAGTPHVIPGAVIPGIGKMPGPELLVHFDEHGNYHHNEACIYTQAMYVFCLNACHLAFDHPATEGHQPSKP
jgi:hypothetical protein